MSKVEKMKIIFMGTPQFSCPTLQQLLDDKNFEVIAVYTREPQVAGRGHKLTNSPIHDLALKNNLPVFTPKTLKNAAIQEEFKNLQAHAAVVVAYGLILPQAVLDAPKFGCINIHPSLLPRWRGPSPIQYTLFADDEEIGVTIIKMDAGIDSGPMLAQEKFALEKQDNYGNLAPKLSQMGAEILVKTLKKLQNGEAHEAKQDNALATFSKKLNKEESRINFNENAEEIIRKIRGLSGSLTAYFEYKSEMIKIYDAEVVTAAGLDLQGFSNGDVINNNFVIKCNENCIRPLTLQRQGKKPVGIEEFLRGFKI